ncbi:MAG TPA: hypothetical protein ENH49_05465, partial [Candidatus Marinimicrobia bacterium]|nr:hypothetical protein [Candidatus Neomarinimicrobiota bacterium]
MPAPITSWTSLGMDWSKVGPGHDITTNDDSIPGGLVYLEALRLALFERWEPLVGVHDRPPLSTLQPILADD